MSIRVKLETHHVEIRKRGGTDNESLNLWNIDGLGLTFVKIFIEFISWLDTAKFADEKNKKVFAFLSDESEISKSNLYQTGRFEYGEFGIANPIKNIKTRKVTHRKTGEEAEVYPLYFCLYIPNDEKQGVFVLQRYGHIAMLTQLKTTFSKFINERYNEYYVLIEPLVPIEILKEYIKNGNAQEVILKRKDIPSDDADRLRAGGLLTRPKNVFIKIQGDELLAERKMLEWLENKEATYIIPELTEIGFDGNHKTTVMIKVNGISREIDFEDTGKIRPYIDIHDELILDKDTGHPVLSEINKIAKKYAKNLLNPDKQQD